MGAAEKTSRFDRILLATVAIVALASRIAARPVAPDGWDGVGFVLAVDRFDLATFQPHPPGYPLFVAACRFLHGVGVGSLASVVTVSIVAGVALPIVGWTLVRRVGGGRVAAIVVACALAVAPGFVAAGSATLSDGAALTLGAATYATCLGDRRTTPLRAGLLAAATIGVRPFAFVLVAPAAFVLAVRRDVRALIIALVACTLGVAVWAIPTACVVGPSRWWILSRVQVQGHFSDWGVPSRGGRIVAAFDAIALQLGAIEGRAATIAAIVLVGAACIRLAYRRPRALLVGAVALPIAAASAFLQPIDAAPRHALPLALAALVLVALALETILPPPRGAKPVIAAMIVVGAVLAIPCVRAVSALRAPPAAVAMLRFIAHEPSYASPAVVGGRSSRFTPWGDGARTASGTTAGDAIIWATTSASPCPNPLLVTSELDLRGVPTDRLVRVGEFERWSPLDRRERALTLYRLMLPPP